MNRVLKIAVYLSVGLAIGLTFVLFPASNSYGFSEDRDLSYLFETDYTMENHRETHTTPIKTAWNMKIENANLKNSSIFTYQEKDLSKSGIHVKQSGICAGTMLNPNDRLQSETPPIASFWCISNTHGALDADLYKDNGLHEYILQKLEAGLDIPLTNLSSFGVFVEKTLNISSPSFHSLQNLPIETDIKRKDAKIELRYTYRW